MVSRAACAKAMYQTFVEWWVAEVSLTPTERYKGFVGVAICLNQHWFLSPALDLAVVAVLSRTQGYDLCWHNAILDQTNWGQGCFHKLAPDQ